MVALISTSVRWYHHDRGHGSVTVCACVTDRKREGRVHVCFSWYLVDSAFAPVTPMHAACYHKRCVCVDVLMWHV